MPHRGTRPDLGQPARPFQEIRTVHEVIHVVDPSSIAIAVPSGLEIEAASESPLAAGYYFVLSSIRKNSSAKLRKRYFGPFATRVEARLLQKSAVALGLVQPDEAIQTIAECRSVVNQARLPISLARSRPPEAQRQFAAA
jgi:hypothetical protein